MQQQQEILTAVTKKLEEETAVLLDQVDMKYNEANESLIKQQADVKAYLEKTKSSLDSAKHIISNGSDEEILSLKHKVAEKSGNIEKERPELMEPVHNGSSKYQAKPSKYVLENVKLNDLGKIGMYSNYYMLLSKIPLPVLQCNVMQFLCEYLKLNQAFYGGRRSPSLLFQLENVYPYRSQP